MCRLFGFRSLIPSQVHRSLVSADNALAVQSKQHPDGWGVVYYVDDIPHVIKHSIGASVDSLFERVCGKIASETVVAHVRKATHGDVNVLNCHPFQFGPWVFAHNGQIPNYAEHESNLMEHVLPKWRRYILGDTDSEVIFYLFLTELSKLSDIHAKDISMDSVDKALQNTLRLIESIIAPEPVNDPLKMSVIVTNGHMLMSLCWKTSLFYSTHKTRCLDRDTCPFLSEVCESPTQDGKVNHFLVSSETLQGDNVWNEMSTGQVVGVDSGMCLYHSSVD